MEFIKNLEEMDTFIGMLKKHDVYEFSDGKSSVRFRKTPSSIIEEESKPISTPEDPLEQQRLFREAMQLAKKEADEGVSDEDILFDPGAGLDHWKTSHQEGEANGTNRD